MLATEAPFSQYFDKDGDPLDDGRISFGVAGQNPDVSPVAVFWDAAGTQPAPQPLRTLNGYIMRSGSPANVFTAGDYSVLVRNRKGELVFYAPSSAEFSNDSVLLASIAAFQASGGSNLVGFIQAGAGAVVRTVQDKLREVQVSVLDFGANTTPGTTDMTTTIQEAIDAVNALGGGTVYFPPGIYLCGALNLKANVRLLGANRTATLKNSTTAVALWITVDGVSNVEFDGLSFDTNLSSGPDGSGCAAVYVRTTSVAADNVRFKNCAFAGGTIRPYIDFRMSIASRGVLVEKCRFVGKATLTTHTPPNSQTTQALRFLCATGCGDWDIAGNTFQLIGNMVQIRHESAQALDQFDSVTVRGNRMFEVLDDPNISTSPMELFCINSLSVTGNAIYTGGRGMNATFCRGASYVGNTLRNQALYFLEMQSCKGVLIASNEAEACKTLVSDTSTVAGGGSQGISIVSNNLSQGSIGEIGFNDTDRVNVISMQAAVSGYSNWLIHANQFLDLRMVTSLIRVDGVNTTGVVISDNTVKQTNEDQEPTTFNLANGSNITVRGNRIWRSANISDTTYATGSKGAFIAPVAAGSGDNIVIEDNEIIFTGTDTRTGGNNSGVIGIGANEAASSNRGNVIVRRNFIRGNIISPLNIQNSSGSTVVEDNDTSLATGTNTLHAAIVYRRTKRYFESAAAPAAGTWAVGDYAKNSAPAVGQPKGWYCTVAGTPGTWVSEGNL